MDEQIFLDESEYLRYAVMKQAPRKEKDGTWTYGRPYIYALASNSEIAIKLVNIAHQDNPRCRAWKVNLNNAYKAKIVHK